MLSKSMLANLACKVTNFSSNHQTKKPPDQHKPTRTVINSLNYPLFYNPYHPPKKIK